MREGGVDAGMMKRERRDGEAAAGGR